MCLVIGTVRAEPVDGAADELLQRLQGLQQLQGRFKQRQYDETGKLLLESSGRFKLLRPGFFSWEIREPDRQLLIADEQYLWHFDRELETVTRRPVSGRAEMSPLQVLGGDEQVLRDSFAIVAVDADSFRLQPRDIDPGFSELLLKLDDDGLQGMEILDKLNQRVVISFDQLDASTGLTPEDFAFTPPEGADIFYYDE